MYHPSRHPRYMRYDIESNFHGGKRKRSTSFKGKTRTFSNISKNRVWISTSTCGNKPKSATRNNQHSLSPFHGVLMGRTHKTRHGHQQFVVNRQLQLAQQSLRKDALLTSARRASLVSLRKETYTLDSSGKKLRKVDPTVKMKTPSNAVKYHINVEASVKRVRAKCVSLQYLNFISVT